MPSKSFSKKDFIKMMTQHSNLLMHATSEQDAMNKLTQKFDKKDWSRCSNTSYQIFQSAWQEWKASPIGYINIVHMPKYDVNRCTNAITVETKILYPTKSEENPVPSLVYNYYYGGIAGYGRTSTDIPENVIKENDLKYLGHSFGDDRKVYA